MGNPHYILTISSVQHFVIMIAYVSVAYYCYLNLRRGENGVVRLLLFLVIGQAADTLLKAYAAWVGGIIIASTVAPYLVLEVITQSWLIYVMYKIYEYTRRKSLSQTKERSDESTG